MPSDELVHETDASRRSDRSGRPAAEALTLLHPILFALFPVLAFLAENIQETQISSAYRSAFLAVVGAVGPLLLFRVLLRDWHKAAIFATLCIVFFSSYGHVYSTLKTVRIAGELVGRHRLLLPLNLAILLCGVWLITKMIRDPRSVSRGLFLASVFALVYPIFSLVVYEVRSSSDYVPKPDVVPMTGAGLGVTTETLPDVYYIILDAYVRSDILREEYGYDNHSFLSFLRSQDFFIADKATSNYSLTGLSLASSLNMRHLLSEFGGREKRDYPGELRDLLLHSRTRTLLESLGYKTVAIESGWKASEFVDATLYLQPQDREVVRFRESGAINPFESMFIRTTALLTLIDMGSLGGRNLLIDFEAPFVARHFFILTQFEYLTQMPSISGPKFVFVHIISPHAPYVFGPNGELITSSYAFTLAGNMGSEGSQKNEITMYRDQTEFITKKTLETIETILTESEVPPIIIVQADHGPGIHLNWDNPSEQALVDRLSILSAYLLPDSCESSLYPTITPVNSFAVLFSCVFNIEHEYHEDRNYYSTHRDPYQFVDVSELVQ